MKNVLYWTPKRPRPPIPAVGENNQVTEPPEKLEELNAARMYRFENDHLCFDRIIYESAPADDKGVWSEPISELPQLLALTGVIQMTLPGAKTDMVVDCLAGVVAWAELHVHRDTEGVVHVQGVRGMS